MRTRFKQEIVAEFLPPTTPSGNILILCDGMPSMPSKKRVVEYWSRRGWWVFHPRYRGTWESGGEFLVNSPHQDVLDVIDDLESGAVTSLWDEKQFEIHPEKFVVLGSSFGGAAALLCGQDERVDKVVALSPVVDWMAPSEAEPLDWLGETVHRTFGEAYRFKKEHWDKLGKGEFFNPQKHIDALDGSKVLIFHAQDDEVVPAASVERFVQESGARLVMKKHGGHLSSYHSTKFFPSRKIQRFIG